MWTALTRIGLALAIACLPLVEAEAELVSPTPIALRVPANPTSLPNLSFSGSLPAAAANTLGIAGASGSPTFTVDGQGAIYLIAAHGLTLSGRGTTNDVILANRGSQIALRVPTGTTNLVGAGTLTGLTGLTSSGTITFSGVTTGTNTSFACFAAGGVMTLQGSACTISSMRFKNLVGEYNRGALDTIASLEPIVFTLKEPGPDRNSAWPQIGLSAENVAAVEKRCAVFEDDGVTPKSYRQECLIAVLVAGMQAQQKEIDSLKRQHADR